MRQKKSSAVVWVVLLLIGVVLAVPWQSAQEEMPAEVSGGEYLKEGSAITQTMRFTRCGHSVTRRVRAPAQLVGVPFTLVNEYYAAWHIDALSPDGADMRRDIQLFCPMHHVLTADETGNLARFVNQYGDGMACEERYDIPLSLFPEETRAALARGIAFDDAEAIVKWLEINSK